MNCKTCGGSTTQSPRNSAAYDCNQDNGDCYGPNGYPTTTWAQPRNNGGQRRAPQQAPARSFSKSTSTDEQIKWQTCLKVAGTVAAATGGVPAKDIIAYARELYSATPTAPARRPVARRSEAEPEPEPDEEAAVF